MRFSVDAIRAALVPIYARSDVRLLVLFGSYATGNTTDSSDVDIGILRDTVGIEDLLPDLMRYLKTDRVDLVDLSRASPLLCMAVARSGNVLYQRHTSEFASFSSLALRRYEDTRKLRDLRDQSIKQFIAGDGT